MNYDTIYAERNVSVDTYACVNKNFLRALEMRVSMKTRDMCFVFLFLIYPVTILSEDDPRFF